MAENDLPKPENIPANETPSEPKVHESIAAKETDNKVDDVMVVQIRKALNL